MWLSPKIRSLTGLLFFLLFTSCGYTLNHRLKDTFKSSTGIFVPVFDNRTSQTGAEIVFTNALIQELQSHSEIVYTDRRPGCLVLQGVVTHVDVVPTANTIPGYAGLQSYRRIPSELGVRVAILFTLFDSFKNQIVWSKELSGFRRVTTLTSRTFDYQAPSSVGMLDQSIVENSYADVAPLITRDFYDEMVQLF
jgi:hypothetical protein